MSSSAKKTAFRFLLAAFMLSLVAVACNNKKDKKEETTKLDTTKIDQGPLPPVKDTSGMDRDTADVRPIAPVDPVKPGE
ncbi:MAG TPA: hypothetical protein VMZ03_08225 [Chitinophagaceae bacterium]|nr:hypothetical protein [Chitinophagaceae bacterium]